MREILFRGRTKDGKWIEGSLDQSKQVGDRIIIRCHDPELFYNSKTVIPETVGQYTGLKDKNGVMIFEGDIVKDKNGIIYEVMDLYKGEIRARNKDVSYRLSSLENLEVIGNIHDNPELLEV